MKRPMEIEPARAKALKPHKVDELWDDPLWIAEEKHDGWRFLTHFGSELDRVYMTGRRVSKRTNQLSEKGLCVPCLWPSVQGIGYTVLDGEIKSPTGDRRDVAGIMNVSPDDAAKRIKEIGEPTMIVWDVLFYDGFDLREKTLYDRRVALETLVNGDIGHPNIRVAEYRKSENAGDLRAYYLDIVRRGGEGVILKDLGSGYGESRAWVKVKKAPTVDVVVTGFNAARPGLTGRYLGMIGSANVSVYGADGRTLIEVASVSGMDDETRIDMTKNPDRWIGSVIEIEAFEFSKDRLLSPRYVCRRDDVDPKTCTFSKMLVDLSSVDKREPEQLSLL